VQPAHFARDKVCQYECGAIIIVRVVLHNFYARAFLINELLIENNQGYSDVTVDALELSFTWGHSLGPVYAMREQVEQERGEQPEQKKKTRQWEADYAPTPYSNRTSKQLTKWRVLQSFYQMRFGC
jgi:hypothetical protein